MLMMKPARQGFRAPWHQDFAFFVAGSPPRSWRSSFTFDDFDTRGKRVCRA